MSVALLVVLSGCEGLQRDRQRPTESDVTPAILSASVPPARLGQFANTPYFRIRALNSKPCVVEDHFAPQPGIKKVAVEVELEATASLEIPSNPFYALLSDEEGRLYESTLAGCTPLLPAERLTNGQASRGWITFDVPEGAAPATLVYQPAVIGISPPRVELQLTP